MNMIATTLTAASAFGNRVADPRVQTWVELRFAQQPMTMGEIVLAVRDRASTATLGLIDQLLVGWHRLGLVERTSRPVLWSMTSAAKGQSNPPEQLPRTVQHWTERRGPRSRMWTAMRVLKRFDLVQLKLAADVSEPVAKQFLSIMERAGYLTRTGSCWREGTRPWGPKHPAIQYQRLADHSVMRIRDRNSGEEFDVRLRSGRRDGLSPFFDREG